MDNLLSWSQCVLYREVPLYVCTYIRWVCLDIHNIICTYLYIHTYIYLCEQTGFCLCLYAVLLTLRDRHLLQVCKCMYVHWRVGLSPSIAHVERLTIFSSKNDNNLPLQVFGWLQLQYTDLCMLLTLPPHTYICGHNMCISIVCTISIGVFGFRIFFNVGRPLAFKATFKTPTIHKSMQRTTEHIHTGIADNV